MTDNIEVAEKIVNKAELLEQVAMARSAGQTVVHCHGCFDIVHPGHVRYLEFAQRQGDLLVVSLTGDSQIDKGDQRPYIPEELRAENLAALEVVDLVYIDPHPTAAQLLAELRPDVYVKGREYELNSRPDFIAERQIVESYGGRVVFSSGDVVFSSTQLIESLGQNNSLENEKLKILCDRRDINRCALQSLLALFAKKKVLVVGDVILDRYVLCDATDLASEAPMMSLTRLGERQYLGGAGIVARHITGLGAKAYLLSTAAEDEASLYAQKVLAEESVTTKLIPCRSRLPEKTRFLVDNAKLLRVEDGESQPLDSVAEREATDWVRSIINQIDAVIFCDFGYGAITSKLLAQLRPILGDDQRIITADVSGPRGQLLEFKNVDLLCPTERELRLALHDFDHGLSSVAWDALSATQSRHMLVTLGKKGLVVFDRESQDKNTRQWQSRLRSEYLPSLAGPVVDPLGGGDTVLAAATLTLAAGGSLMQAAYLGSAAAAIAMTQLGNIPIDLSLLQRWLIGRAELADARKNRQSQANFTEGLDVNTNERRVGAKRFRIPLVKQVDAQSLRGQDSGLRVNRDVSVASASSQTKTDTPTQTPTPLAENG